MLNYLIKIDQVGSKTVVGAVCATDNGFKGGKVMGKHVHENLVTLRENTPRHATYPRPTRVELAISPREGDVTKAVPHALPSFPASFIR